MAYTTFDKLFTADLVDATYMTKFKNNLDLWNSHTHDGTTGGGATSLPTLTTITFTDQSDPTAPASGKLIINSSGGLLKYRQSGGTVKVLSTTDHTH